MILNVHISVLAKDMHEANAVDTKALIVMNCSSLKSRKTLNAFLLHGRLENLQQRAHVTITDFELFPYLFRAQNC